MSTPAPPNEAARQRCEALLREYGEVCGAFRLLTDIRFKLLALVPLATAVGVFTSDKADPVTRAALGAVGLAVLLGVVTYNARNDQLYDELVGRAAAIERELGLPDGAFANRPRPWLTLDLGALRWPVHHRLGVGLIYAASIAAWLFGLLSALAATLQLGARCPAAWPACMNAGALVLALGLTLVGTRVVAAQRTARQRQMREAATAAVNRASAAAGRALSTDDALLDACADLIGGWPVRQAVDHRTKARQSLRRRAEFLDRLAGDPAQRRRYWPDDATDLERAAYQVAFMTDLPPRWLHDVATGRRG